MLLEFRGFTLRVTIVDQSIKRTQEAGEPLKHWTVQGYVKGAENSARLRTLIEAARKTAVSAKEAQTGRPLGRWRVVESRYSQAAGTPPIYFHTLELVEFRPPMPDRLILETIALMPYAYEETEDDDRRLIVARAEISPGERDQLLAMSNGLAPIQVVRQGLSETPWTMYLDTLFWSQEREGCRCRIVLIGGGEDGLSDAEGARLRQRRILWTQVVENKAILDTLLALLRARGDISEGELQKLAHSGAQARSDMRRDLCQVDDVDAV